MINNLPPRNHIHIKDDGITIDGVPLLVEDGGVEINPPDAFNLTRVTLTILHPRVTIE